MNAEGRKLSSAFAIGRMYEKKMDALLEF